MAVGFGPVDGRQNVNSTFKVVKSDGTVVAECKTRDEAEKEKIQISQSMNEELQIKEHKLI